MPHESSTDVPSGAPGTPADALGAPSDAPGTIGGGTPADAIADLAAMMPEGAATTNALADLIGEHRPTELYLHLLMHGACDEADLAAAGFAVEATAVALRILTARAMVERDSSGWRVTPPEQALPTLAGQLESRATSIRAALPGLVAAHRNAAKATGANRLLEGTDALDGEREVAFAFAQCVANARHEVRAMRTRSIATRSPILDALPGSRDGRVGASQRLVTVDTVIDSSLVADFDADDFASLQPTPNVRVTLATGVPFTAAVNDDGMAVIETVSGGGAAGLVVHDAGLVAAVSSTIDLMLRLAAPLAATHPRASTQSMARQRTDGVQAATSDALSDQERLILTLLAAGVPDATVARRVGVSQRTFDRRVRSVMDRLNARTRFQAGVLAARRGWL